MKRILIVDGNSIVNRGYYGVRPLTTKDGQYTNAVFGMLTMLKKHLDEWNPDVCAIAFDRKEPTFRHLRYEQYKAGRHETPEELRSQFPIAKECAAALGFTVVEQPGYEADDILGTLSEQATETGEYEAYLMTGDRDALQLISEKVTVLLETNKGTVVYTPETFTAEYGIPPECFVEVKALMGDKSDNIPGVAGIGEVTACKLIAENTSLENLYDGLEDKKIAKGVKEKLTRDRENAFFSRMLATIVRDAPLDMPFATLGDRAALFRPAELRALFVRLEFSVLIKRFGLDGTEGAVQTEHTEEETVFEKVLPTECTAETLCALPETSPLAVSYDAENSILYTAGADTVYCTKGTLPTLSAFLCNGKRTLYTRNVKDFFHTLADGGLDPARCPLTFDTVLAAYVLDPGAGEATDEKLCMQYLGRLLPEDADAATRTRLTYLLKPVLAERMETNGLTVLYETMELPLAAVLYRMEARGFKVDTDGIRAYGEALSGLCDTYAAQIYMLAGKTFNINSPKQLAEVLFDDLALPLPDGMKRSTNADILDRLRPYHPIIAQIEEYRSVAKLKSTYTDGLLKVADENGVIHTTFNQCVTATGRLSSTEPNLQNIPIRTELGRALRKYFIPSETGRVLVDADYSQIELRLLAAIAGDEKMIAAYKSGADIHALTASQVFGVPPDAVTPELRKRAKAVNFGIVYGIGGYSLSQDIGVSVKEASDYIARYLGTYPRVSEYLKEVVKNAKKDGYVTTIYGRRRYIPELSSTKKPVAAFGERVAMNSPIQGSAADIIKAAMISLDRRLTEAGLDAHLILQVHDELIVDAAKSCEAEVRSLLRDTMEHICALAVPLTVDVAAGDTWYDGH